MRNSLYLAMFFCLISLEVQAHKVVASVWTDGPVIEGEAGFSNGDMALKGTPVEVFNDMDEKVGETQILDDGLFRFTPKEVTSYRFTINFGAGHVVSVIMNPDELPENLKTQENVPSVSVVTPQVSTNTAASSSASEISQLVAKAVRKEIQPLRKEIASYKEKNDLQSILGGIGYILGISGIAFYMAARRKEGQNA